MQLASVFAPSRNLNSSPVAIASDGSAAGCHRWLTSRVQGCHGGTWTRVDTQDTPSPRGDMWTDHHQLLISPLVQTEADVDVGLGCDGVRQRNVLTLQRGHVTDKSSSNHVGEITCERRLLFEVGGGRKSKIPTETLDVLQRSDTQTRARLQKTPPPYPHKQAPPVVGVTGQHLHDSWSLLFHLD